MDEFNKSGGGFPFQTPIQTGQTGTLYTKGESDQVEQMLKGIYGTTDPVTLKKLEADSYNLSPQQQSELEGLLVATGYVKQGGFAKLVGGSKVDKINSEMAKMFRDYTNYAAQNPNAPDAKSLAAWAESTYLGNGGTGSGMSLADATLAAAQISASTSKSLAAQSTADAIEGRLMDYGFSQQQLKALTPIIQQQALSGLHASAIMSKLMSVDAKGNPNTPESAIYFQRFPGNLERVKQGLPPLAENVYISYENSMYETARQYGLPRGTITPQVIGNLIANRVSPSEFNQRVQQGYVAVEKADPAVKQQLQTMFGVTPGQLAHYFLDPKNAADKITQQVQAAKYGAEAKMAGFDSQMSAQQAMGLAQYQATTGASEGTIRQQIDTAARYQALEGQAPGQQRAGLTQAQLIGAQVGNDPAAKQAFDIARAQQITPMQSGGGDVMTAKGVVGAGFAQ